MENIEWSRTDLIDETDEMVSHRQAIEKEKEEDPGITYHEEQYKRVHMTTVVVNEKGEREINKKEGTYITLSIPTLSISDEQGFQLLQKTFVNSFKKLHESIQIKENDKILVIGLGNKTITPDAVGPFTIDAMQKEKLEEEESPFLLFAPGVTGQTGLETSEFVRALADKIQPALIVTIDALATRGTERLCRTVQLTNTGIHPGSGVGNSRAEISTETMGYPVTAIGVPTVVGAPVIVSDLVDKVFKKMAAKILERQKPSSRLSVTMDLPIDDSIDLSVTESIFGEWVNWDKEERQQLFTEVLTNKVESLIVTPKEIDIWIVQYSILITNALFEWRKSLIS